MSGVDCRAPHWYDRLSFRVHVNIVSILTYLLETQLRNNSRTTCIAEPISVAKLGPGRKLGAAGQIKTAPGDVS